MEELVLALAIALAVGGTVLASRRSRRTGPPGVASQVVVGLACGVAGALAAAIPHADVIPDGAEPLLVAAFGAVVVGVVLASTVRWAVRRRPNRGGRPSRPAGDRPAARSLDRRGRHLPLEPARPRHRPARPVTPDRHR